MGYNNPDRRWVKVSPAEKRVVTVKARRAHKRVLKGEHPRGAITATRRGWWYA